MLPLWLKAGGLFSVPQCDADVHVPVKGSKLASPSQRAVIIRNGGQVQPARYSIMRFLHVVIVTLLFSGRLRYTGLVSFRPKSTEDIPAKALICLIGGCMSYITFGVKALSENSPKCVVS